MIKSTEDIKIYFVTIPAHTFCTLKTMRATAIGISGKTSLIPGQDCEQSAVCSTVSREVDDVGGDETNSGQRPDYGVHQ